MEGNTTTTTSTSRKVRIGVVASNKMDKTISVLVERKLMHPIYGKFVKKSKKFFAHDENNDCNIGDLVKIEESRPLSKLKRWRLVEILERAK
ncbi:MAG: 30S ribosomal protein S17 [Saprospiraceae bacterium]|nr:30S ribosomal protein S17 [Saprospiraceae bacterium]MDP4822220.1 30S ribosomal protein S17 [Saprospiraceae bacterium]MDP4997630.1 30S ribosomal protein S17 [Saprospiraceae bacterium]